MISCKFLTRKRIPRRSGGSRIFPRGGVNPPGGAWTRQIFPKTAWNRKNLDAQGGRASLTPPLDPPMRRLRFYYYLAYQSQKHKEAWVYWFQSRGRKMLTFISFLDRLVMDSHSSAKHALNFFQHRFRSQSTETTLPCFSILKINFSQIEFLLIQQIN